jgi:Ser-tRNA(Ala) deacylase AlaX
LLNDVKCSGEELFQFKICESINMDISTMEKPYARTSLLYMDDSYIFTGKAKIVEIEILEEGKSALILDQTVFYPQGGGQPCDIGVIKSENSVNTFKVEKVGFNLGWVQHIGTAEGQFKVGDEVVLEIDETRRRFNSRLHSAGHMIDYAAEKAGVTWKPTKAFQFPEGPYVEYEGADLLDSEKQELIKKIQKNADEIIALGIVVTTMLTTKEELSKYCSFVPDYIPEGKPVRIVIFEGFPAIPCGGTHVKNTKEIGVLKVLDIVSKKGNIRIKYNII